jgi:hypothetical protein
MSSKVSPEREENAQNHAVLPFGKINRMPASSQRKMTTDGEVGTGHARRRRCGKKKTTTTSNAG